MQQVTEFYARATKIQNRLQAAQYFNPSIFLSVTEAERRKRAERHACLAFQCREQIVGTFGHHHVAGTWQHDGSGMQDR